MSIKVLRNSGIRPNLEKDENYENNNSYLLKGQRVYNPQRNNGGLNELYYEREIREAKKELEMTYLQVLEREIQYHVIEEENDEYDIRDIQLLDVYCSMNKFYRHHKEYNKNKLERAQEILKLIKLTKTFKHVKGASNGDLIVFDLQRKNIGEWE